MGLGICPVGRIDVSVGLNMIIGLIVAIWNRIDCLETKRRYVTGYRASHAQRHGQKYGQHVSDGNKRVCKGKTARKTSTKLQVELAVYILLE
jgi:hypothetical protein